MLTETCYPCLPTNTRTCVRHCVQDAAWTPAARPAPVPIPTRCPVPTLPAASASDTLLSIPVKLDVHLQECASCARLVCEVGAGNLYTTDVLLIVCVHLSRLTDLEDALAKKHLRFADVVTTVSASLGWPLSILLDACTPPALAAPGCQWFDVALWRSWPPYHCPDRVACVEAVNAFTAIEYLMRYCWWWSVARSAARALTGPSLFYHAKRLWVRLFDPEMEVVR